MTDHDADSLVVLTVNPGSTSTKVTLFRGEKEIAEHEIDILHQSGLRGPELLAEAELYAAEIRAIIDGPEALTPDAVVGRGGFIDRTAGPVTGGVYNVARVINGAVELCDDIICSVTENPELDHASNLGIPIAARLAQDYNIPAFCVDPVVADDFSSEARFSGLKGIERRSAAHALSVRMLAKLAAAEMGRSVSETSMAVAHMGGGITVAAVRGGLIVDCNIALLGGGPFSPQRVGSLPMAALIDLCFDSGMSKEEIHRQLTKNGGLMSYLNEDSLPRITDRIDNGDSYAKAVVKAMAYQVAKEIGAMAVAAGLPLDAVVFSGGLSKSEMFTNLLRERVRHLAPIHCFPGSVEMRAMARGAVDVLTGKEDPITYYLKRQR